MSSVAPDHYQKWLKMVIKKSLEQTLIGHTGPNSEFCWAICVIAYDTHGTRGFSSHEFFVDSGVIKQDNPTKQHRDISLHLNRARTTALAYAMTGHVHREGNYLHRSHPCMNDLQSISHLSSYAGSLFGKNGPDNFALSFSICMPRGQEIAIGKDIVHRVRRSRKQMAWEIIRNNRPA